MSSAQTERLEALIDAKTSANKAELKTALERLATELQSRGRHSSRASFDFFGSALKTLGRIRGAAYADARLRCLFDCVNYFYNEGFPVKALEAAAALRDLAAATGDPDWTRKSYTCSGVIHADVGNVGDALVDYSRALELCTQLKDDRARALVLINAGVALNYAGLYQEAIPCFQRSSILSAPPSGDPVLHSKALINHAQSLLYLERFQEGFQVAERAMQGLERPQTAADVVSRIVKEVTLVQLALEVGKLNTAREHSRACVSFAMQSDSPRVRAMADLVVGLCEVHGGQVDRGLSLLEKALSRSTPSDTWWLSLLVALVKAYDVAGDPDRALSHMRTLLDHLRTKRRNGLSALCSHSEALPAISAHYLQPLELREARLEARVAERVAAWQRVELLERMAVAADLKEDLSGEHAYRVGKLASLLAAGLGWDQEATDALDLAARLHDIGKIAMPDRILLNSKELQAAERHFMSTHTTIGAELLGKSNIPQLRMAEEIARHHHEWWNGEGYPAKLKGKRIPIHARIVALADVFDALTHGRPFSPAWPIDKALAEIAARKGTQFDPELTDLFLQLVERLRNEHQDLDEYLGRAGKNSPFLQARNRIRQMLADEREHEVKATVPGNATQH